MRLKPLPIDNVLPQLTETLREWGSIVLVAEPGAGKTTRVPPALLDAGLANLPNQKPGQIIVLQPRRVAARTAASRMSQERGSLLGEEIGYQVRHERKLSDRTRILVCTEGIFLRRLQGDPLLEDVAVVIFDEFHERSLDSDLALALVRQVAVELRPDLRIVVMSATIDSAPVSKYLGTCPIIESPGRTFPVEIEYLKFPNQDSIEEATVRGLTNMLERKSGHTLAFLPGIGEIRRTQALLEARNYDKDFCIMQLYGEMPLLEQQRVLQDSPRQKIILATNVAETSITIDGVSTVIDSGMSRTNRLDMRLGLNKLELGRISKASANQRAGRAGRTAPGACLRLWTEREHEMLAPFNQPEILQLELSECVLQLLAWGESDIKGFPWFESPPPEAIDQSLVLLDRLGAISEGQLTALGKQMSRLPLQPRLARLVLEGKSLGQLRRAAICAALLSERDPIRKPQIKSGASPWGNRQAANHSSASDVLDRLWAIEQFEENRLTATIVGEINANIVKQIMQTASQVLRLTKEGTAGESEYSGEDSSDDEAILKALLAAFPDKLCRRRETDGRRAVMVGGRGVKLADESAVSSAELFLAIELLDTGKAETLVRMASKVNRNWLPASNLSSQVEISYDSQREKIMACKRTRFCDLILEENPTSLPADADPGQLLAKALATNFDLNTLVDDQAKQYLARIAFLREHQPELNLPEISEDPWRDLLPQWCTGCSSLSELKAHSALSILKSLLSRQQTLALDKEAPEKIEVPSGNQIKLNYEFGKTPILAVRIQELFGLAETPRIASGRAPLVLHLLAPNYRVQQITTDLASFWKNTYGEVRKDLKARYPKHSWPENPLSAPAERGAKKRH